MQLNVFKPLALATMLAVTGTASQAADWQPSGPIKMMIAFRAGGGVDTQARLLAEELSARQGWEVIPENVAGKGGVTMANALSEEPADGLTLGMLVTESLTYNLLATRGAKISHEDFTAIATTTGTQLALFAKKSRGWENFGDVVAAVKNGEKITVGSMSPKLADVLYLLGKANDVEFTNVMVKGGKGGLNGVVADDLDIAWGAGPQTKGVKAGELVNLISAESDPLAASPGTPKLADYGVPYEFGTKFLLVAPAGLPDEAREAIATAVAEIVNDPDSKLNEFVSKAFSGPEAITGAELDALMDASAASAGALLDASSQ